MRKGRWKTQLRRGDLHMAKLEYIDGKRFGLAKRGTNTILPKQQKDVVVRVVICVACEI